MTLPERRGPFGRSSGLRGRSVRCALGDNQTFEGRSESPLSSCVISKGPLIEVNGKP